VFAVKILIRILFMLKVLVRIPVLKKEINDLKKRLETEKLRRICGRS
jgi:hypothetical protein